MSSLSPIPLRPPTRGRASFACGMDMDSLFEQLLEMGRASEAEYDAATDRLARGEVTEADMCQLWTPLAIPLDATVCLTGLSSRADLNGKRGRVISFVKDKHRYGVSVLGEALALKPGNLEHRPGEEPDPEPTQETCTRCQEPCVPGSTCRVPHPTSLRQDCGSEFGAGVGGGMRNHWSCEACGKRYTTVTDIHDPSKVLCPYACRDSLSFYIPADPIGTNCFEPAAGNQSSPQPFPPPHQLLLRCPSMAHAGASKGRTPPGVCQAQTGGASTRPASRWWLGRSCSNRSTRFLPRYTWRASGLPPWAHAPPPTPCDPLFPSHCYRLRPKTPSGGSAGSQNSLLAPSSHLTTLRPPHTHTPLRCGCSALSQPPFTTKNGWLGWTDRCPTWRRCRLGGVCSPPHTHPTSTQSSLLQTPRAHWWMGRRLTPPHTHTHAPLAPPRRFSERRGRVSACYSHPHSIASFILCSLPHP